ncbi:pathogen-related protein [Alternaria alternata]|nr:pathogen-related protein [Alternaria alternata]
MQQGNSGIGAGCGNRGNDLNTVHAGNADLDSENSKHNGMTPYYQTTLYLVPQSLPPPIVLKPPFLQRQS